MRGKNQKLRGNGLKLRGKCLKLRGNGNKSRGKGFITQKNMVCHLFDYKKKF